MRKQYIQEKDYTVVVMRKGDWWKPYQTDVSKNGTLEKIFSIEASIGPGAVIGQDGIGRIVRLRTV